jgi:hypothetical protein
MTDKEKLKAKMTLVTAYLTKFGEPPDENTEMIIDMNLERVHAGEKFRWEESGPNWRVLHFGDVNAKPSNHLSE